MIRKWISRKREPASQSSTCGAFLCLKMSIYIPGAQFGKLTILSHEIKDGKRFYLCSCQCGNLISKRSHSIKTNISGCRKCSVTDWNKAGIKSTIKPHGRAAFNKLYLSYKRGAKKKNRPFELTKDEFKAKTSCNCHYCGALPNTSGKRISSGLNQSDYLYNGIDRKDNEIGYTVDNTIPCCKTCNFMKGSLTYSDFLSKIKLIFFTHFPETTEWQKTRLSSCTTSNG